MLPPKHPGRQSTRTLGLPDEAHQQAGRRREDREKDHELAVSADGDDHVGEQRPDDRRQGVGQIEHPQIASPMVRRRQQSHHIGLLQRQKDRLGGDEQDIGRSGDPPLRNDGAAFSAVVQDLRDGRQSFAVRQCGQVT